jgi:DNA helicase-2/ATP-dependent DNA helicase PcrA
VAPDPDTPIDRRRSGPDLTVEDVVELATFHRAKGLEWTAVNVIGLEEGFVPIVYAQSGQAQAEERRLLYVAMTRASRQLHCSWARSRTLAAGRRVERQPSPWLSAVVGAAHTATASNEPRDAGQWIAEIRATLST